MISFEKFLNEIAVSADFINKIKPQTNSLRSSSKITPATDRFNIIPVRITYATYNVFKRYISPKFELADKLLNRRGDSVSIVTVKASNEELANLKEMAEYIIENAPEQMPTRPAYTNQEREIAVAKLTIKDIENSMLSASGTI